MTWVYYVITRSVSEEAIQASSNHLSINCSKIDSFTQLIFWFLEIFSDFMKII